MSTQPNAVQTQPTPIDLSAGLQPKPTAPAIDLSAGLQPKQPAQSSAPAPALGVSDATHFYDPATKTIQPIATISATPKTTVADVARNVAELPVNPLGVLHRALGSTADEIENYTEEGREEHPILSRVGDVLRNAQELLEGGQSVGKSQGTSSGLVNNPVTTAISLAPGAAEVGAAATDRLAQAVDAVKAARAAKAAQTATQAADEEGLISRLTPDILKKRPPTPAPLHGIPVVAENTPFDSATINKVAGGGKQLSREAVAELQSRQGTAIPVGSTAQNRVIADIEPNDLAIRTQTAKLNQIVRDAKPAKTSVLDSGDLQNKIADLKSEVPQSLRKKAAADIDAEVKNASDALKSKDLQEILDYRRKLGGQIDWNNVGLSEYTPGEIVNSARATIYRALTDKIHTELPETVAVDGKLAPNLELRSFYNKINPRGVEDPASATAEANTEFRKGKTQVENAAHNAAADKYRQRLAHILTLAGIGTGYDLLRHFID
jgi:hypothetical protein